MLTVADYLPVKGLKWFFFYKLCILLKLYPTSLERIFEMKKEHLIILIGAILLFAGQSALPAATIHEKEQVIKTYPFSEPDPIPIMIRSSMWGGGSRIYPYFFFSKFTNNPVDKTWKVVHLQNPYIDVFVLPEVGGKVWGAVEKYSHTR